MTNTFVGTLSFQVSNKPRFNSVAPMEITRAPGPVRTPPPKMFVRKERSGDVLYRPVLQQRPLQTVGVNAWLDGILGKVRVNQYLKNSPVMMPKGDQSL